MTTIDWEKEVEGRKEQLMNDLKELIRIDSVKDLAHKSEEFPVGPGPAKALKKFLEFGERDGFTVKNIENVAGHIEFGEGDETLGVLGHVDVVPVGDGWDTDPFDPVIIEGRLYARGSSDDKGPAMAAYYGLKIIKELNLPVSKKVRFIIGTDEESGWYCMDRYKANEKMPDFGFSPDAQFPIINGEKGIASFVANFNELGLQESEFVLDAFNSGLASNMVPGDAHATILVKTGNVKAMVDAFGDYIQANNLGGTIEDKGGQVEITLLGKQAHAQNPKAGVNAGTYLCNFLANYSFDPTGANYLRLIAKNLHDDYQGNITGIAHVDEVMGELTMSPNIFKYERDGEKSLLINIRYPKGTTAPDIEAKLQTALIESKVVTASAMVPHYAPIDDPMVQTLFDVYEKYTGQKGVEKTIGGGTYGRLFERGVGYGALFPGREDVMHQANEYMYVEDIYRSAVIYAEAIYRLIK